jgi:Ser/Thr protein kinase RdoA (MazF antagonist)
VGESFGLRGLLRGAPLGRGHIHETYDALYAEGAGARHVVHQRLHTGIFRNPDALMENVVRVTARLRAADEARGVADPERRALRVLEARGGRLLHRDAVGGVWRSFAFIEGARSVAALESADQARAAARAYGRFAADLADLPAPPLHVTIPHFHDLERRLADLERARSSDIRARRRDAAEEIAALRAACARLEQALPERVVAALPRRVVHHDCKLDNLLFDAESGEPLCVVDLDTVMEGTLLSDFGELVRSAASRAAEDERDLARVDLDLGLFEALATGYLEGTAALITAAERRALPLAGCRMALMNAARFLADHLEGDVYFRIDHEGHNLERARSQLRLGERMLAAAAAAARIVESAAA